jgi:hypothetical protein
MTIAGFDEGAETFLLLYADARGVSRVSQLSLDDGVWKIWGKSGPSFYQRFTGTFADDGNTITGRWERSSDSTDWETDFDVRYSKVSK